MAADERGRDGGGSGGDSGTGMNFGDRTLPFFFYSRAPVCHFSECGRVPLFFLTTWPGLLQSG